MIHEFDLKLQLAEEELKTKAITIERQSHELEDRADQEGKQDREIQVCTCTYTTIIHVVDPCSRLKTWLFTLHACAWSTGMCSRV